MIIDASVGAKWLTQESDSDLAFTLLTREDLAAPDIFRLEIGHLLGKRLRRGEASADSVMAAWGQLGAMPIRLEPFDLHLDRAFELSSELRAALYDCVYLAIAHAEDDVLVTADERFVRTVRQAGGALQARHVRLLREFTS